MWYAGYGSYRAVLNMLDVDDMLDIVVLSLILVISPVLILPGRSIGVA